MGVGTSQHQALQFLFSFTRPHVRTGVCTLYNVLVYCLVLIIMA
jgi:hypothetical protein